MDFIAILRPTQSVSLYQQIVVRGLRLEEGKRDCLVIDYAGNSVNLHHPEVGEPKPNPDSEPVQERIFDYQGHYRKANSL